MGSRATFHSVFITTTTLLCISVAHGLRTVVLGPQDGQVFADTIADFGSTGLDTLIFLPRGFALSLRNVTVKDAQPPPGYTPFSSGTLTIRPAPGNSTAPTILDAAMLHSLNSHQGRVKPFSQTAKLEVYDITLVNNCDWQVMLEDNSSVLWFDTGVAPSFMISGTTYQAFNFYNTTFYLRQADIMTWYYTVSFLNSPFPQIRSRLPDAGYTVNINIKPQLLSMYAISNEVASFPGVVYYNTTLKAISDPADPLLQSMRDSGRVMPPTPCNTDHLLPLMINSLTPMWMTSDTASWLNALSQATNNLYVATGLGLPVMVVLAGTAAPAAAPSPPTIAPLIKVLVLSGPPLKGGEYLTEGILDLRGSVSPLLYVKPLGQLFLQSLRLRNLPTQPMFTSGTPSAFPLAAFSLPNNTYIQAYNVTLELPDLDYLALAALAQPAVMAQVNASVRAHAAALQAGIQTVTVDTASQNLLSLQLATFKGWGLNATNLQLQPSQPSVAMALALQLAAVNGSSPPAITQASGSDKEFTKGQMGAAVAGTFVAAVLLSAGVFWGVVALRSRQASITHTAPMDLSASDLGKQAPDCEEPTPKALVPISKHQVDRSNMGSSDQHSVDVSSAEPHRLASLMSVVSELAQHMTQHNSHAPGTASTRLVSRDVQALEAFCSDNLNVQLNTPRMDVNSTTPVERVTLLLSRPNAGTQPHSIVPSAGRDTPLSRYVQQTGANLLTAACFPHNGAPTTSSSRDSAFTASVSLTIASDDKPGSTSVAPTLAPAPDASEFGPDCTITVVTSDTATAGAAVPNARRATPASYVSVTSSQDSVPGALQRRMTTGSSKASTTGSRASDPKAMVGQLMGELQGDMNKVEVEGVLGQGAGGTVYSGRWRGLEVALKTMIFEVMDEDEPGAGGLNKAEQVVLEVAVTASVDHPNVVQTYYYDIQPVRLKAGASQLGLRIDESTAAGCRGVTTYKVFLIQERCMASLSLVLDHGRLHDDQGRVLQLDVLLLLLLDIAKGLEYLHSCNVVHGDLKPANILLSGRATAGVTAKLADFGLSARLGGDATHVSNYRSGTPFYVAPEVVHEHRTSPAADIFSFGVIMWQLHTGEAPYIASPQGAFSWNPAFPHFAGDNKPMEAYAVLCDRCMRRDPKARPAAWVLVQALQLMLKHVAPETK